MGERALDLLQKKGYEELRLPGPPHTALVVVARPDELREAARPVTQTPAPPAVQTPPDETPAPPAEPAASVEAKE